MKYYLSIFFLSFTLYTNAQPDTERQVETKLNSIRHLQWHASSCNSSLSGNYSMEISFQIPVSADDSTAFKNVAEEIFNVAYNDILRFYPLYDRVLILANKATTKELKMEIYIIAKEFWYRDQRGVFGKLFFTPK